MIISGLRFADDRHLVGSPLFHGSRGFSSQYFTHRALSEDDHVAAVILPVFGTTMWAVSMPPDRRVQDVTHGHHIRIGCENRHVGEADDKSVNILILI